MLRRAVSTSDLRIICKNQERDAYAEVIGTCGALLEDSIRAAWSYFREAGPPDEIASIDTGLGRELGQGFDQSLNAYGVQRMYWALKRSQFFRSWAGWRDVPLETLENGEIEELVTIRNDAVHRRQATLNIEAKGGPRVDRKKSRDIGKATIVALRFLGQIQQNEVTSWVRRLGERPRDPSLANLPNRWYPELVGRSEEVDAILGDIQSAEFRRFALDGLAGVGKSSIALEVATRAYAEGVVTQAIWVSGKIRYYSQDGDLVEEQKISDGLSHVTRTILKAFSWVPGDGEDPTASAIALLESCERPLLVIDNWESLQHFDDLSEFLLRMPTQVKVVYTSRRAVTEARPRRIDGLSFTATKQLLGLLLRDSPHWIAVLNHPPSLREIHAETRGNPLLITMLAAVVRRSISGLEESVTKQLFRRARGRDLLEFMHDYNIEQLDEQARTGFTATPMLDSPIRPDWMAAALNTDYATARRILDQLVEVNLAESVQDNAAASSHLRQRYRVHVFSLEYARRLLESAPDLRQAVGMRLAKKRAEDEASIQLLTDGGLVPTVPDQDVGHRSILAEIGWSYRRTLETKDVRILNDLEKSLASRILEAGWYIYINLRLAEHVGEPASAIESLRARVRKAEMNSHSEASVEWLVRDAIERQKPDDILRFAESEETLELVDPVAIHKLGVALGRVSRFETAERIHLLGLRVAEKRSDYRSYKQRQYFLIGLAENMIVWARTISRREASKGREILTRGQEYLQQAQKLPFPQTEMILTKIAEITKGLGTLNPPPVDPIEGNR